MAACGRAAAVAGWALAQACGAAAAEPAAAAPAYVDRLIEGASPQPEVIDDGASGFDASGAPRALRVESRAQSSSSDQGRESSAWVSLRGAMDTANYGAFSLDASARLLEHTSQERRGAGVSFSLYQTALPFAGGWYASQGLGVIQTLSPRLAAQQASFFVPTRLVQGASTQWRNEASGLTLQLSGGETGAFSSIGQGSFFGSGNRVAAIGVELQPARAGIAGLMPSGFGYSAIVSTSSGGADQVLLGFGQRSGEPSGSGVFQSLRWESADRFVQGNLLASRNEDPAALAAGTPIGGQASRMGGWIDGALQSGEFTQRWGLHHLASGLSWQGSALGGNTQGGYYRWSVLGLRTQLDTQVSMMRPIDLAAGGSTLNQVGVSVRHYLDQQLGIGGVVQINDGTTTVVQASGYAELHSSWADLRLQTGFETSDGRIAVLRVSSDQAWVLPIGRRLSTSQALTTTRSGTQDTNGVGVGTDGTALELAIAGGADLGERLTLDVNARASLPLASQAARVYNVSASSQWHFARGWSLGAALGWSRASGLMGATTATPIPSLPGAFAVYAYPSVSSRDLWLTLRYDFQGGTAAVPIGAGARVGAGGGAIEGVVYLDENRNGRFDALEIRAANVTVMLDGRYVARTDAQGRFEFPFVASGMHAVMVVSDTLPLPWVQPSTQGLRVEVVPRETTRLDIGATRE